MSIIALKFPEIKIIIIDLNDENLDSLAVYIPRLAEFINEAIS